MFGRGSDALLPLSWQLLVQSCSTRNQRRPSKEQAHYVCPTKKLQPRADFSVEISLLKIANGKPKTTPYSTLCLRFPEEGCSRNSVGDCPNTRLNVRLNCVSD